MSGASVAAVALASALLADPALPGPDVPPVGVSTFEAVFAGGAPFPFATLVDRLRDLAGAENVSTALIPLGRALQRFAAHPDYFGSPRVVVAVTGDRAAGPGAVRLADRLFVGYQPASEAIEIIAYNEAAGRFEFQQVSDYGPDRPRRAEAASREVCTVCHQGHGPIFARPLWGETNANPEVAERLSPLGAEFQGVPVRQSVDAVDRFDAATDRAARIALANRLWDEGCGDSTCRAALLTAALRYGLNGARPGWRAPEDAEGAAFAARSSALWPEGLAIPDPDLPNLDPVSLLSRVRPEEAVETAGSLNPETPRAALTVWKSAPRGFDQAARAVAAMLSAGDFGWLDRLLRERPPGPETTVDFDCAIASVELSGGSEMRLACDGGRALAGFVSRRGGRLEGRIDQLAIAGLPPLHYLDVAATETGGGLELTLREAASGLSPRLADGRRITGVTVKPATAGGTARVRLADDLAPLAAALARLAGDRDPLFGPGPFRREAALAKIQRILEGVDG